jgi:hypothetical protein
VLLDGAPISASAASDPVRVDPGLHELSLREGERVLFLERLDLREGERRVWTPVLPAADSAAPARPDTVSQRRTSRRRPARQRPAAEDTGPPVLGYVGVGVGTAAIAASLVLGLFVLEKKQDIRHCEADGACNQKGVDAASAGTTLSTLSAISAAIGVPALALGGYLLLSYDPPRARDPAAAAHFRLVLPTN